MMTYSNPRQLAEFNDWPIGGSNRGQCRYEVEHQPRKGYRVVRTTTNKYGIWCKPKPNTYGGKAVIAEGSDGRTYIIQRVDQYQGIKVETHDFMSAPDGTVYKDSNPERYAELYALIETAYPLLAY